MVGPKFHSYVELINVILYLRIKIILSSVTGPPSDIEMIEFTLPPFAVITSNLKFNMSRNQRIVTNTVFVIKANHYIGNHDV